jgi:hypothetical protein
MTGWKALDVSFLPSYTSLSRGGNMGRRNRSRPPIRGTGGCLCGAVRYEVRGPLRPVVDCHCSQCRRTSGHFAAFTATRPEDLVLIESGGLRWYRSSATARRGFCEICGSSLFWEPASGERVSIAAGTLDPPTRLSTAAHVFVEDSGDYYAIGDGLPRRADGDHGIAIPAD